MNEVKFIMGKDEREITYLKEESLLKELRDCLKSMKGKGFAEGIKKALVSLQEYFEAKAAMLVYRKEEDFDLLEVHGDSADEIGRASCRERV